MQTILGAVLDGTNLTTVLGLQIKPVGALLALGRVLVLGDLLVDLTILDLQQTLLLVRSDNVVDLTLGTQIIDQTLFETVLDVLSKTDDSLDALILVHIEVLLAFDAKSAVFELIVGDAVFNRFNLHALGGKK